MKLNIDQVRDHLRRGGARPELIASVASLLYVATRPNSDHAISEMISWRKCHIDNVITLDNRKLATQTEIEEAQKRTGITL